MARYEDAHAEKTAGEYETAAQELEKVFRTTLPGWNRCGTGIVVLPLASPADGTRERKPFDRLTVSTGGRTRKT